MKNQTQQTAQHTPGPKVGDVVRFMTRNHPTMGEEYEVIGRVGKDDRGLHAGGRFLNTAIGDIVIVQGSVERAAPKLLKALKPFVHFPSISKDVRHAQEKARAAIAEAEGGGE